MCLSPRSPAAILLVVAASLGLLYPRQAVASKVEIPIVVETGRVSKIKVFLKDKDGRPIELVGELDTGNEDGFVVNAATAAKLGLTPAGKAKAQGVGQAAAQDVPVVDFKGDQTPKVNAKVDGKERTLTLPGKGSIAQGVEDNHIIFGQSFFASFGKEEIDKVNKIATYTFADQVEKKGAFLPFEAPMTTAFGAGAFRVVEEPGPAHFVDVSLAFGANTATPAFALAPRFETSLLSSSTATALGIVIDGLPQQAIHTLFGSVLVPVVSLDVSLFAVEIPRTIRIGIVPDALNPDALNVLGSDLLGGYAAYSIDLVNERFAATPVPEPATVVSLLVGLGWVGAGRRRRARGRSSLSNR